MGEGRGVHRVLVGKMRERDHWGDLEVDGRIILRWMFGKCKWVETGWSWLRIGTDGGVFEYGDEPSSSIICGEFLD